MAIDLISSPVTFRHFIGCICPGLTLLIFPKNLKPWLRKCSLAEQSERCFFNKIFNLASAFRCAEYLTKLHLHHHHLLPRPRSCTPSASSGQSCRSTYDAAPQGLTTDQPEQHPSNLAPVLSRKEKLELRYTFSNRFK